MFINMDKKSLERDVIKTKLLAILLKLLANLFLLKQTSVFKQSVTSAQIDKLVFETLKHLNECAIIDWICGTEEHWLHLLHEQYNVHG